MGSVVTLSVNAIKTSIKTVVLIDNWALDHKRSSDFWAEMDY